MELCILLTGIASFIDFGNFFGAAKFNKRIAAQIKREKQS